MWLRDADGDETVIAPAFSRHCDRTRDFECTRHRQDLYLVPRLLQRSPCASDKHVVEVVVEARFDNQELGHGVTPE